MYERERERGRERGGGGGGREENVGVIIECNVI